MKATLINKATANTSLTIGIKNAILQLDMQLEKNNYFIIVVSMLHIDYYRISIIKLLLRVIHSLLARVSSGELATAVVINIISCRLHVHMHAYNHNVIMSA